MNGGAEEFILCWDGSIYRPVYAYCVYDQKGRSRIRGGRRMRKRAPVEEKLRAYQSFDSIVSYVPHREPRSFFRASMDQFTSLRATANTRREFYNGSCYRISWNRGTDAHSAVSDYPFHFIRAACILAAETCEKNFLRLQRNELCVRRKEEKKKKKKKKTVYTSRQTVRVDVILESTAQPR